MREHPGQPLRSHPRDMREHPARQNSECSVSSGSSLCSDPGNVPDQHKTPGLPELIDKSWWIRSFFHCEPSLPTVGRKMLSAS
ncbi:PREDICTED: pancreatic progenitor cell differentiation and proliferation factor-like protein, partial [Tinamus guttatus]|uniref:pancreatic progenitor cell differentiation and proliferation factor-like protein n=1 Tax=Tinamus guttatus TaxID=94827 RepID=UPI00052EB544